MILLRSPHEPMGGHLWCCGNHMESQNKRGKGKAQTSYHLIPLIEIHKVDSQRENVNIIYHIESLSNNLLFPLLFKSASKVVAESINRDGGRRGFYSEPKFGQKEDLLSLCSSWCRVWHFLTLNGTRDKSQSTSVAATKADRWRRVWSA